MAKEEKSLTPAPQGATFPALIQDPSALLETIRENTGGESLNAFDLDRLTIPSGGGLAWTVPTLEGPKPQQFLFGVIVYVQNCRAYWATTFDAGGGGNPPDCTSDDGVNGHGTPGGSCKDCPFAQFGSGRDGRGQACKQLRRLFMLREDEMLPMVVSLPPSSLKNSKNYLLKLASHSIPATAVVTRIGLETDKSGTGILYSKATFAKVADLPPDLAATAKMWKKLLETTAKPPVDATDYASGTE